MKTIHVKNLEKYHPGYKDRTLQWAKIYFTMVNGGDPVFDMVKDEIAKWRFVAIVILELQAKQPLPLDDIYFKRRGFDLKKQPISVTIQLLHNFIQVRSDELNLVHVDKEEDKEIDKSKNKTSIPTQEECRKYFQEKGFPQEADAFFDHHSARSWIPKGHTHQTTNWHGLVGTWIRFSKEKRFDSGKKSFDGLTKQQRHNLGQLESR